MDITTTLRTAASPFRELVAPKRCMGCLQENTWLCVNCRQLLPIPSTTCIGCSEVTDRGFTCSSCRNNFAISGVTNAGHYHHPTISRGVSWLKFKGIRAIAPELAALIIPRLLLIAPLPELATNTLLVPIPLHHRRFKQRGFNQSEDIASAIAAYTKIPTMNLLKRVKQTWTQSRLPHELRKDNAANAFSVVGNIALERNLIILVDDVTTTGATLESAARALRSHYPQHIRIWAATVAQG